MADKTIYVTLEQARRQTRAVPGLDDEDLFDIIEDAQAQVADDLQDNLSAYETSQGVLKSNIRRAILLLIGTYFKDRESTGFKQEALPDTYYAIITPNKKVR